MAKTNHPPAFLFYPDDFSSDGKVEAMSTEQVGAYILLLCKSWREDPPGSLPDDDCVLARWARVTPDRWTECRTGVLAAFKLGTDSRWHQKRQRIEYEKLKAIRKQKVAAAKAKWNHRVPSTCIADAVQMQSISFPSPSSIKEKSKPTPRFALPDWVPLEPWEEFIKTRKKPTVRAKELLVRSLKKLRDQGYNPKEIIERSIERGWTGFYPPRSFLTVSNDSIPGSPQLSNPFCVCGRKAALHSRLAKHPEYWQAEKFDGHEFEEQKQEVMAQ